MKKIVPYIVLLAMIVSILVPVGVGYAQRPNLMIAAGELRFWDDWSINPCKYVYENGNWPGQQVDVTVSNYSNTECRFDMGDGNTVTIPAHSSLEYSYQARLNGQIQMITITRIVTSTVGINMIEQLALKIQPK